MNKLNSDNAATVIALLQRDIAAKDSEIGRLTDALNNLADQLATARAANAKLHALSAGERDG